MKHIEQIMTAMERRFGSFPLKEGQSIASIKASWERALGCYEREAVTAVAKHWADTTKYSRWPECGELLDLLKQWGHKPERHNVDNRPPEVRSAEQSASVWYGWLLEQQNPAFGITNSYLLSVMLKDLYPSMQGSFSFLLTRAFLQGILPDEWESRSSRLVEDMLAKKSQYKLACDKYGVAKVNESNGAWQAWKV